MKRALGFALPLCLVALVAWAGPRPRANVTVSATTVVTHSATESAVLLLQCPQAATWYRTFTTEELANQDGGPQADGGAFGVLVDFRTMGDPTTIVMGPNQVALGLLGIVDAGSAPCFIATP